MKDLRGMNDPVRSYTDAVIDSQELEDTRPCSPMFFNIHMRQMRNRPGEMYADVTDHDTLDLAAMAAADDPAYSYSVYIRADAPPRRLNLKSHGQRILQEIEDNESDDRRFRSGQVLQVLGNPR